MDPTIVLPHLAGLYIEQMLVTDAAVTLAVASPAASTPCPDCGAASGRETVYHSLRLPEPPPPKRLTGRRARSALAPYVGYLLQRWEEGGTNATRLWREIRARGYPGSSSPVSKLARHWPLQQRAGQRPTPLPRATKTLTVRQAVRLFRTRILRAA